MCDYCNKGLDIERMGNILGYRSNVIKKCHRCEKDSCYMLTEDNPKIYLCRPCADEYHKRHAEMLDKFLVSDPKGDKHGGV